MKKLLVGFLALSLASCNKSSNQILVTLGRTDFFRNDNDAKKAVQHFFDKANKGEKLEQIESISYVDSRSKSYAFIFFSSNKGNRNMVLERASSEGIGALKVRSCDGDECNCKVRTVIGSNGEVTVNCSCSSCSMVIDKFSDE